MTDFVATTSNTASVPADSAYNHASYGAEREIDLKEALDWLLSSHSAAEELSDLDVSITQRRLDLIMWLMNLERRLSPYGEPA